MFRALILILFGLAAGAVGYQAGVAATATQAGTTVVVMGGFPGIGTVLLLFLIAAIAFGGFRRRAWAHHGGWGPMGGRAWGGPAGLDKDDPRRQWVAEMHRRLHEADATERGSTSPGSATPDGSSGSAA